MSNSKLPAQRPLDRKSRWGQARSAIVVSGLVLLAACGGNANTSQTEDEKAIAAIAELMRKAHESQQLPNLDRSTSIAGPDANNNAIRDDIDAWIASQNFSESILVPLQRFARALQETLVVDKTQSAKLQDISQRMGAAITCLIHRDPKLTQVRRAMTQIEAMTANTPERSDAYMDYNSARSGSVGGSMDYDVACNYEG